MFTYFVGAEEKPGIKPKVKMHLKKDKALNHAEKMSKDYKRVCVLEYIDKERFNIIQMYVDGKAVDCINTDKFDCDNCIHDCVNNDKF